jgi:predicted MPP superfamily phosphohydrolase
MAGFLPAVRQQMTRRRLLKSGLLGAAGLALYSGEVARHWIEISRIDILLRSLPAPFEGLRIAQLSDIHLDEYTEPFFLRHAIEEINRLQPDLVLLTGDFVSNSPLGTKFARGAAWQCANILHGLTCKELYAVPGNHDVLVGEKWVSRALTSNGITMLTNTNHAIERGGSRIWLAGVDDPVEGDPDPEKAIPPSIRNVPNEPVVLMCHAPDYADDLLALPAGQAVDLMVSGHTHGGQVRLPLIGALTLPPLGQQYVQGWFKLGGMQLYVNRGIGTVGLPFRLNCPPEITLITLRRG